MSKLSSDLSGLSGYEKHPAFEAFKVAIEGHSYGEGPLNQAWHFFKDGWTARDREHAGMATPGVARPAYDACDVAKLGLATGVEFIHTCAAPAPAPGVAEGAFELLAKIRGLGWDVAVHNDYRIEGQARPFWLFTHPGGRWAKGEGRTDDEALMAVWRFVQARETRALVEPASGERGKYLRARLKEQEACAHDWLAVDENPDKSRWSYEIAAAIRSLLVPAAAPAVVPTDPAIPL